jgi:peptidoglycan/LPS O-acetylase OafA/YrhL
MGTTDLQPATPDPAQLDGLRGVAILSVLVWHFVGSGVAVTPGTTASYLRAAFRLSWTGVDLFFVLSGFLIGGILLDARDSRRYFRTFYVRRFCRILPLYWLLLAAFAAALWLHASHGWFEGSPAVDHPAPWWAYLTFTQNFYYAAGHFESNLLALSWSLAVEEQFYLTLPPLVWLLPRRALAAVLCLAAGAAPLFRHWVYQSGAFPVPGNAAYVLPVCRMDALALGVLGALLVRSPGRGGGCGTGPASSARPWPSRRPGSRPWLTASRHSSTPTTA